MCRDRIEGQRRCPCDTSEARRLRRQNSAARDGYAALAEKPVEPKSLPVVQVTEPYTTESIQAEIASLHTLAAEMKAQNADSNAIMLAYDKKLNVIGAGVEYLAETKYGSPTDAELVSAVEMATLKAEADAMERRNELRNKLEISNIEEARIREKLSVHADRETHPIIKERHAVWEEKDPENYAALQAKIEEGRELSQTLFSGPGRTRTDIIAARRELLEKRNEAMLSALKEVGVVFADPESIEFSDDSHADAVKSLKNALPFYPQSWVDASNASNRVRPLRIKRSKGRAHYSSSRGQNTFTHKTEAWIVRKPIDWKPDPHDPEDSKYISLEGKDSWVDPKSGIVHEDWYGDSETSRSWVSISYEYAPKGTTPKGKSWEKVEHYESIYVSGEGMKRTGNLITRYRKPRMERSRASTTYKAELTVTKDSEVHVGNDAGMRVALHEFAHRVEGTTQVVTAYEEAFLKRRAGHLNPDSSSSVEPEQLTKIYAGKKEVGFKDNFPSHYMGKVYADSSYREIFSMGMESLFAGTNGALAGLGNHKADADYKKFILGVLASSVKK
jgi:hypothetical protein